MVQRDTILMVVDRFAPSWRHCMGVSVLTRGRSLHQSSAGHQIGRDRKGHDDWIRKWWWIHWWLMVWSPEKHWEQWDTITWTQSFVDSLTYKQKKEKSDTTAHCDTQTHSRSEEPWPFKQGRPCSFASSQSHLIRICEDPLAWVLMWTIPLKQLVFGCFKPVGLTGAPLMEPRHICRPERSRCPLSPFPFMSPTRIIV